MSVLDSLKITSPLGATSIFETEYVNIDEYKFINLCGFANNLIKVSVVFSVDGVKDGPCDFYVMNLNNCWSRLKADCLMPFCKLKVENFGDNQILIINITGQRKTAQLSALKDIMEPSPEEPQYPLTQTVNRESKSPFRRFSGLKSISKPKEKIQVADPRLPDLVPKNAIVIGGYVGNLVFIPPPERDRDCVLVFKDNTFQWIDLPDPKVIRFKV